MTSYTGIQTSRSLGLLRTIKNECAPALQSFRVSVAGPHGPPQAANRRDRITAEMELARTFVSFSSTDIQRYHMMCAWKAHEHIDFNFADFQLEEAVKSNSPYYIKSKCAAKIRRADTFVLLIGADTYTKTQFVEPAGEAAIEKRCRLIGVNLNNGRFKDGRNVSLLGRGSSGH
jgi:hypothetical protein